MYYFYILEGCKNELSDVGKHIYVNYKNMVLYDKKLLKGYKKLCIPDIKLIKNESYKILEGQGIIEKYWKDMSFFMDIIPYLQFLYTIRELRLENVYKDFLDNFVSSKQYKVYIKYNDLVNRVYRWSKVLI